jgi:GT2 family glycosyltransferase
VSALHQIAAVVIGRNEGSRLEPSLRSVQEAGLPVVYVDSGSRDGSPNVARKLGIALVELDPSRPFTAGRGRNEGVDEVLRRLPATEFVVFLDGDCVLDPAFPSAAADALANEPSCAIVTGHLSERFPERSIYNRLCAIEWRSPAGAIENMSGLGGIMMIRVSAFRAVGGFDLQAIAGEEPDLGARLRLAGFSIRKIDRPMAAHDADMTSFGQWWTRAVRGGHALAHRYASHGRGPLRDGRREIASDLFWGLALPIVALALLWPTRGRSAGLLAGYIFLGWRVYRRHLRSGLNASDSALATRFIVYSKFAHVAGFARYVRNRLTGQFHIIEYK